MSAENATRPHSRHDVQFYEELPFLAARVGEFLGEGLAAGEAALMIVAPPHTDALLSALGHRGLDVDALQRSRQLIVRDARALLATFMPDGNPDEPSFTKVVGGLVDEAKSAYGTLRAYGEMVNILWQEGNGGGAVTVERLWNRLLAAEDFPLLCGYALDGVPDTGASRFEDVCGAHARVAPAARSDYRVLVIDDNQDSADGLLLALEILGYQARAAYDAPSALAAARELAPQLVMVDIGLPMMDGYELAMRLREQAGTASPRLVALTGYGQESDHARSRAAGFQAHLVKPVDLAKIQALVGRARAADLGGH